LNRWKNISQFFNVHRVSDSQAHRNTYSFAVTTSFEIDIAIAKLKWYKSLGSDEIPQELIQA
jgi:hypothetical protein